ncbi:MAG TPA: peptidylprolyl isomerase [Steroidobacteraceae bacterium]|jgi:peptidylprolyl isomerase|nr:peptidylprolyl isomerase [Steroidobacteraceae bacterium]
MRRARLACLSFLAAGAAFAIGPSDRDKPPTTEQVMNSAKPEDWRRPDPANTLYMELAGGRVIIELAPRFAPLHVANIKRLVAEKYFDGLAVIRVQDNYVVQWGDPDEKRSNENAGRKIGDETVIAWGKGLPLIKLPDPDGYAPEAGWIDGFPAGVERKPSGQAWLIHCYGVVGVGRGGWPDTGSGAELYTVIGQAPRHLDRNIVTVGRVLRGVELLSSLPRGPAPMGFYEKSEQRTPIKSIRLASDVPEAERSAIEVLRTDTPLFTHYVEARRNRREEWFLVPAHHTDVCNINIPVRDVPASQPAH